MSLPYNRALHPDDYDTPELKPYVERVRAFERERMGGLFYRKDHIHREWEYANILRQLEERFPLGTHQGEVDFFVPGEVRILDTGFGINYFTLMLKTLGYNIIANDSEDYGKVTEVFQTQCLALGLQIPLVIAPVQNLGMESNKNDVTLCISVIEHLHVQDFENGLRELVRVTKPCGYVMITSDFFRNEDHALTSPSLGCQHNRMYEKEVLTKCLSVIGEQVDLVGGVDGGDDTEMRYRGDFVNGHSFCNMVFQKRP